MRIAHAALVSFCLFWGAAALPMSITLGLKQLTAFKTMCIIALIWPIIEAFLMYLIAGAFAVMIDSSGMGIDAIETWSLGTLVFYMGAFSIINCILVATTLSAPFIAQGLANGTGNVTGMIGSFGAAGVTAGVIAGKSIAEKSNWLGDKAAGKTTELGKSAANNALNGLKNYFSTSDSASSLANQSSGAGINPNSNPSNHVTSNLTSNVNPTTTNQNQTNLATEAASTNNTAKTMSNKDANNAKASEALTNEPLTTPNSLAKNANVSHEQLVNQQTENPLETPESDANKEAKRKKDAQAKRGAIINQHRNAPR